ncbi:CCR4-NOT regulatory complex component [Tilletia horrida]|uniref:CCR4-NOT regulatory complex component n=1 Tax=Tilletia horrida TaxID=155126 RepID=A0AAN6JT91_9BASI|nr:CCR4-NOT regulatory complex component [Tilletia horrida]KAK0549511.1 CCR4-NOT regulatory complex component [Tilletia horrida]KAK0564272.1 CCR4-NOT regulatory complex component [Tilletia horrida]
MASDLTSKSVCVFCGSSPGSDPIYLQVAAQIGHSIANKGWRLVYGGGQRGCMGQVSNAALQSNGHVLGVMPKVMLGAARGHAGDATANTGSTEGTGEVTLHADSDQQSHRLQLEMVDDMHERKQLMAQQSGLGFIGLPGGFGTFEEVMEMVTWTQLGIHRKPVVLVNVNNFWSPLKALVEQAVQAGFILEKNSSLITFVDLDQAGPGTDWGEAVVAAIERESEQVQSTTGYWDWNSTKEAK